ncbi:hypothetical protein ALPR1_14959 [Algoriphagus machipongonensis]|uniref:Uncharacterized protein n=2 Tax=Algoriphagus machipongonensis TaxID=388413 RepID=A3I0E3_9BACT|nr:hypothetical protein ALPR1_14959 [Algoriphagus machipongonensis]
MIDSIEKSNEKKHLLIVGKSEKERREFVDQLVGNSSKVIYRFPANIQGFDQYIDQVRTLFPFIPVNWYEQNPKKWTTNQVWDFHLDWTENTHSILIVMEEFGLMEEDWKIEILRHYLITSYHQEQPDKSNVNFQLILTQQEDDHLVDKLSSVIELKENEKRSARQMIEGKLKIVNLDWV